MSYAELYIAERIMHNRLEERRQEAKSGHTSPRTGQDGQGWLAAKGRWLLCELGYRLVTLGAWLEGYSQPRLPAPRL